MIRIAKVAVASALAGGLLFMPAAVADTFRVRATSGNEWRPDFRHITRGDRIVWKNPTNRTHTVVATSDNWNKSTTLNPGEKTGKRFRRNGTYRYRCTLHSGMRGEIHVQGS